MECTKDLVLKVNELYHDFEGELYHEKHDDIFDGERNRWDEIGKEFLAGNHDGGMVLLDVGTGTGFVPLTLVPYLSPGDLFICSDISQNILNAAERNLGGLAHRCRLKFLKLDGDTFGAVETGSVDIVTVNSVMHHLPDFGPFFREMERIVKVGGKVIIGHEPNQSFFRNGFLWRNYEVISYCFNPSQLIYRVAKFLGLLPLVKRISKKKETSKPGEYHGIVRQINDRLVADGLIEIPLSDTEVSQLIDFQSPTAGGLDRNKGIDMPGLLERYGRQFSFERYDTYNHVYRISHKNALLRWYSRFLSRFFPREGAAFFTVLKKTS